MFSHLHPRWRHIKNLPAAPNNHWFLKMDFATMSTNRSLVFNKMVRLIDHFQCATIMTFFASHLAAFGT